MSENPETPIILVEDGETFLNRDELDQYRTQKIEMEWEGREPSDG